MPEDKTKDTKTSETTTTETPTAEAQPNAEANTSITVADLRNLRTIIDVASTRGAFKGAELKPVGEAFDKLDQFIKAIDAKAQTENPAPVEGETKEEPAVEGEAKEEPAEEKK